MQAGKAKRAEETEGRTGVVVCVPWSSASVSCTQIGGPGTCDGDGRIRSGKSSVSLPDAAGGRTPCSGRDGNRGPLAMLV